MSCPYCELKSIKDLKVSFDATSPKDGRCPDCGAYIDRGQYHIEINSYPQIYAGALKLIGGMVEEFNSILAECDVVLSDYIDTEDGKLTVYRHTSDIVAALFAPYAGGTTLCNLKKALSIEDDEIEWTISAEEI